MNANNLKNQQQTFHNIANRVNKSQKNTMQLMHQITGDYKKALAELEKCKTQLKQKSSNMNLLNGGKRRKTT